ncbi:MAG: S9 family peptidase, partial [Planctomycetota bacterium]
GAHSPAFSPGGKSIAFLSRVNEEERKEASRKRPPRGAEESQRIQAEKEEKEKSSKDPRVITRLFYRTGQEWIDGRWNHVFISPVNGSKPPISVTSGEYHHTRPKFHPSGDSIFTTSERTGIQGHEEVYDILRVSVPDGNVQFITEKLCVTSYDLSPDGKRLAYTSVPAVKYFKHPLTVKVRDLESGREDEQTGGIDADLEGVRFGRDGSEFLFLAPMEGENGIHACPVDGGGARRLTEGKRKALAFDVSPATGSLAFVSTAPDVPADLYVIPSGGEERRVTALSKGLIERRHMAEVLEVEFEGHDGLPIQGWVMKARGFEEGEPGRLAVEVHGGPHVMWGWEFWHEFQVLASAGYSVFFCNPRGSGGYGLEFKSKLYRNWGVDDSKDILAGAQKAVEMGLGHPDQLYLTGGSYGGYMTAWIVTHHDRFKAAVAQRGVYNLLSMYNGSDAQCLLDWEFDTAPWDDPMLLVKHSPVHYADRVKTPTMVMHAECDFTATIPSAEEFYNAIKRNGVDCAFVRYPREGHELSRSGEPDHRVDRISRILGWFESH